MAAAHLSRRSARGRMKAAPKRLRYVRSAKTNMPPPIDTLDSSTIPVLASCTNTIAAGAFHSASGDGAPFAFTFDAASTSISATKLNGSDREGSSVKFLPAYLRWRTAGSRRTSGLRRRPRRRHFYRTRSTTIPWLGRRSSLEERKRHVFRVSRQASSLRCVACCLPLPFATQTNWQLVAHGMRPCRSCLHVSTSAKKKDIICCEILFRGRF